MRRRTFLLSAAALAACSSKSSDPAPATADSGSPPLSLDAAIEQERAKAKVPGLVASIVKGGKVVWTRGYGHADVEKNIVASERSIFILGSVSKPIAGAAVMQQVEQGKLALDDDVSKHVGFSVRHPKFPDVPITLRMLMTHMSSITESQSRLVSFAKPGDSPITMQALCEGYFKPGGEYWSETDNFTAAKPGTKFSYSNFGATLAGYAAERVSGLGFAELCIKNIFEPLGMKDTSYRLKDLDLARVATPYTYTPSKGQVPQEQRGVPYLPATNLRTSGPDLARFFAAIARGGELDGVRILKTETTREMQREHVKTGAEDPFGNGLLWEHRSLSGIHLSGHRGSFYGASTSAHVRDPDGDGVILLANSDVHLRLSLEKEEEMNAFLAIEKRLYEEIARL